MVLPFLHGVISMMDRRAFIDVVAVALLTFPLAIEAQQAGKVPRIGYVVQNYAETSRRVLAAFREGLREHGWLEGQNIVIEVRFAEGKIEQLPAIVAELIRLKVDLIMTTSSATTWAAKDATKSIPIVMAASANAHSRALVGWAMSRTLDTKLAMDALNMAIAHRGPPITLHSDQGSTYATGSYRQNRQSLWHPAEHESQG